MKRRLKRRCCDTFVEFPHAAGCSGDDFRRTFVDGVATCGCRWERRTEGIVRGDVLVQCELHERATKATL